MSPIADYDLGTAHGEVKITYDGNGVARARDDMGRFVKASDEAGASSDRASGGHQRQGKSLKQLGADARDTRSAVESLAGVMTPLAKPVFLAGAAGAAGQLTAALAPAIGAVGILPGVLGMAAASMAVVKIGTSGMGDAFKAVAEGDAKKLAEAMAKLSPEAQGVVRAYQALKPQLDGLKLGVQNALFKDMGGTVQALGNTFLPTLTSGLTSVAAAMNRSGQASAKALMQPFVVNDLNELLAGTAGFWDGIGNAIGVALGAFLGWAAVGATYLPALGAGISNLVDKFSNWTDRMIESGQAWTIIDRGLAVLKALWQILVNIGAIAVSVFRPLMGDGEGLLQTMVRLTGQAREWAASAEGQQTIANIWTVLKAVAGGLMTVIATLAPIISAIANAFGALPGPVQAIIGQFLAWGITIGFLLMKVAPLITGVVSIAEAATKIPGIMTNVSKAFGLVSAAFQRLALAFLMNPWLLLIAAVIILVVIIVTNWDTIKEYLASAWEWIKSTAETVWNGIVNFFKTIFDAIVGFFAEWGPTILAILAPFIGIPLLIYQHWDQISAWLGAAWEAVKAVAMAVWNAIVSFIVGIWVGILATAISIWQGIVNFFTTIWDAIKAPVLAVWNGIVAFLTAVWEVIFNILRFAAAIVLAIFFTIFGPLINLAISIWTTISTWLQEHWTAIVAIFQAIWMTIVAVWTMIWTAISTAATTAWNFIVNFLTTIWNGIVAQATALWNLLVIAWQTMWTVVSTVATTIWNAIVSFLTGIWNGIVAQATALWNAVWGVISGVWNRIWGFIGPILSTIGNAVSTAWNAIVSTISNAMNRAWSFISNIWNQVVGFLTGVWARITGAVGAGVSNVMSTLQGLWSRITGLAGSAMSLLVNAGRNIVQGLWNGIVAMGSWLYNSLMGWIRSVVPGPILQFLGIASPSKWMRDMVGENIVKGLAVGVEQKAPVAEKAAGNLAAAVGEAARTESDVTLRAILGKELETLPRDLQKRLSGLTAVATTPTGMTAGVAPALATTSSSSSTRTISIGGLEIKVTGNLDPTKPVQWRQALESLRDGILEVERSYQ